MTDPDAVLERVKKDAEENGFYVCPDKELLKTLCEGIAKNEERYGYGACPCRITSGIADYDSDIVCPCEYRDADVNEFGCCYCALYVSKEVADDPPLMRPVKERRPIEAQDAAFEAKEKVDKGELVIDDHAHEEADGKKLPVWRCKVCGYIAARERPPPICPICKAKSDKFEKFGYGPF